MMNEPATSGDSTGVRSSERSFFDRKAAGEKESAYEAALVRKAAERALDVMGIRGDIEGRTVLECACGTGRMTPVLAARARRLCAFDLSPQSVRVAADKVGGEGLSNVDLCVAAMEQMPFPDGSFDLAAGLFILHHLADPAAGVREIARVLKPGAKAVFFETSGRNRFLMFCRRRLAGRFGIPRRCTDDEHPLTEQDYAVMRAAFPGTIEISYPQFRFLTKIYFHFTRGFGARPILEKTESVCRAADGLLSRCFPFLRRYSYVALVTLKKGP